MVRVCAPPTLSWADIADCVVRVLRAFPVKELVTEDDTINAEMDPEDVFKVTEHIQDQHDLRWGAQLPGLCSHCSSASSLA